MEITLVKNPLFSYVTFENIFTQDELDYIWQEVDFLCHPEKLLGVDLTGGAIDPDTKQPVKRNRGLWLEHIYMSPVFSNYLKIGRKAVDTLKVEHTKRLLDHDFTFNLFYTTTSSQTLMSYYENEDYYGTHTDKACYTYLFWLHKEPKAFDGGELTFGNVGTVLQPKTNTGVLFPSWANHSVEKVKLHDGVPCDSGMGRFAFSTFYIQKSDER